MDRSRLGELATILGKMASNLDLKKEIDEMSVERLGRPMGFSEFSGKLWAKINVFSLMSIKRSQHYFRKNWIGRWKIVRKSALFS